MIHIRIDDEELNSRSCPKAMFICFVLAYWAMRPIAPANYGCRRCEAFGTGTSDSYAAPLDAVCDAYEAWFDG